MTVADALNAALVHAVWQNGLVVLALWTVLALLRHRSANARYVVCCAALGLMVALPAITAGALATRPAASDGPAPRPLAVAPAEPVRFAPAMPVAPADARRTRDLDLAALTPWALPLWVAGVLLCSVRLVVAGAHTVRLRRRTKPADPALASMASRLAARLGIRRRVSVCISTMAGAPATLGCLRPVILLPPAAALGVTPGQLEALLAHELAHVRRHDYLVNVLQLLAETILFYHPAVWWTSRRIRVERERCCDDEAARACGDAVGYARALATVAQGRVAHPGLVLGADGGTLLDRIQRLLGVTSPRPPVSPPWIAAVSIVMLLTLLYAGGRAQSLTPGTITPAPQATSTALQGRVVNARTGEAVAGAAVRAQFITGVENPTRCGIGDCEDVNDRTAGAVPVYRATTSATGRFEFTGIRAGEYFVDAVAPGYAQRSHGQTSQDLPEIPVYVAPGSAPGSVDVRLEPAGSIRGHVLADDGTGIAGVEVELLRRTYLPGGTRPAAVAFAQTETGGAFAFTGVTAGEYYIRAYTGTALRPAWAEGAETYVATLLPGVMDLALAQPVTLAAGQELGGVDFPLATAPLRTVSGRLVDPAGGSLTTASVRLMARSGGALDPTLVPVGTDGRFRVTRVPPGDYMLMIGDASPTRSWSNAVRDIDVVDDVTDLVFVAGPSVFVNGRIVQDGGQRLPFDASDLRVYLRQRTSELGWHGVGAGRIDADGTFSMWSGTGMLHVEVNGLPPRWYMHDVRLNGADAMATALDLTPGDPRRLEIVLSNRTGRLTGVVTDRTARPVPNALVVVFPDDRSRWSAPFVRAVFSYQLGRYDVDALPIGSYRVVAVPSLPRNAWTHPEVLDRLWSLSTAVWLGDGIQHALDVRVVPVPADLVP